MTGEIIEADAALVGTGQAAPALAIALAERGERVVLFEGGLLGGTCVNTGCTPTKTLRKSARVAHMARRAGDFGVHVDRVAVDFAAAMGRMNERVDASRASLQAWIDGARGVTLVRDWASFAGRTQDGFELRAGDRTVRAKRVYLNTGTRPFIPSIPGLADVPHLDNASLLAMRELPAHLVIIGGSYIGLEMGQIYRRLGSRVSIVETGARITEREDPEVSTCITSFLRDEGIEIHTGQPVARVERTQDGVAVMVGSARIEGTHVLVATGRVPNTDKLNLGAVGVQTDSRGFVPTNGRLETNVPGIWALGDINKCGAFTHTSYHDFTIVLANLGGGDRSADDRVMAYAMYTDPPLGRVGMSEAQARATGRPMLMATFDMKDVSRAKEESETVGLIRLLVDATTERFVGATLLGIGADELLHVFSNFMAAGGTWRQMHDALPVHPTVAEFFPTVLERLKPL